MEEWEELKEVACCSDHHELCEKAFLKIKELKDRLGNVEEYVKEFLTKEYYEGNSLLLNEDLPNIISIIKGEK